MKKVTGISEYSSIVKSIKARHGKVVYNVLLFPEEVERHISHGRFYCEESADGVIFYDDERDFYKLYCCVNEESRISIESKDKPQILEFIANTARADKKAVRFEEMCRAENLKLYVTNMHVRTYADSSRTVSDVVAGWPEDDIWSYAEQEDSRTLYELWDALDRYDSILPRADELKELIGRKEIVCIRKSGDICAAARIKTENSKTQSYWLVTTNPKYRRQGYATRLYDLLLALTAAGGYVYGTQWCDVNNKVIIKTTDKFGFEPDGLESREYIIY